MDFTHATQHQNERAIDLVHLARQSLGDKRLECELLAMFDRQSRQIVERLNGAEPMPAKAQADLVHTLLGSALAVGANNVAQAAAEFEAANVLPGGANTDLQLKALRTAVAQAHAAVVGLLAA